MHTIALDGSALLENPAGIGSYLSGVLAGFSGRTDLAIRLYVPRPLKNVWGAPVSIIVLRAPRGFWHFRLAWELKKHTPDLFHAPHSLLQPLLFSCPVVLTIHDLVPVLFPSYHTWKLRLFYQVLLRRAVQRAQRIFAVSESTKHDLLMRFPFLQGKVAVTYPAVMIPITSVWKPHSERPYILWIGTLEPRKNVPFLIEVFNQLAVKHPTLRLVFAGSAGWGAAAVFEEMERSAFRDRIEYRGYITDTRKRTLLTHASLMVFPSLYEGFGMPVLEAMSMGVPVVASNRSSIPEVAGKAAVLFDPESVDEAVSACQLVLAQRSIVKGMSDAGIRQAAQFSVARCGAQVIEEYRYALR